MAFRIRSLAALGLVALAAPLAAQEGSFAADNVPLADPIAGYPLVIAHRGASGERPEETLAAYERALDEGADWLETDVVPTSDGVLVLRHENELSQTTDVAVRPEFANRKTTKIVDGEEATGWFSEDFTLAELRTLRARERMPQARPANTRFDGLFQVATLAELLQLMQAKESELGRPVTLLLELKHPTYFAGLGHDLATLALADLDKGGYAPADPRIVIQSFELGVLCRLSQQSGHDTVLLADPAGGPVDVPGTKYPEMLAPEGLALLKRCADGIGAHIGLVLNGDGTPAPLMEAARDAGMPVYAWTLRRENAFLPEQLRIGTDPTATGDIATLAHLLSAAGVAGIITDNPAEVGLEFALGDAAAAAAEAAIDATGD